MKIALLGYGKMGQVIESQSSEDMKLSWKDENNTYGLANADVAIDFSIPTAAVLNITIV
jgi:4-hydroxy-tetrahydrodipicolinate reductase